MQTRLRYWFRFLSAFLIRFRVILFVGIVFGLLFFSLASFMLPRLLVNKTEYIGITGRYNTQELPLSVLSMLGEGLTKTETNGGEVPALAEKWEVGGDGREWTFYLKKGLVWHDGSEVTANSIQYSFEDTTIERPDAYTIKFKLSSPFSPFPTIVSRPTFKKGLLGTGEWKVVNLYLNGTFVEELVLANGSGEKKIIRFYPSEDGTKIAYQLGQIDSIVDALDPKPFDSWSNSEVESTVRKDRIVAVFFNNESQVFKGPENKPLRQALSYAIDKDSFGGPRALGPISPESWAYNPLIKDYSYDLERAKELIEELNGELKINLSTSPTLLPIAEKIVNFWNELEVKTDLHVTSILPEQYDAFLAIYDVPRDPDQYAVWHTTQTSTNVAKYSNPRNDKLLEDGRVELNHEERKKIYLDFQRFLLEDAPAVFLYHPVSYTITRK